MNLTGINLLATRVLEVIFPSSSFSPGLRDQLEALDFPSEALHTEVTMVVTGEPPGAMEEELDNEEEEESSSEVIDSLYLLDVLRVSAILEDIVDQLSILGYIIPVQYERKQSINQVSTLAPCRLVSLPFDLSVFCTACGIKLSLRSSTFTSDNRPDSSCLRSMSKWKMWQVAQVCFRKASVQEPKVSPANTAQTAFSVHRLWISEFNQPLIRKKKKFGKSLVFPLCHHC